MDLKDFEIMALSARANHLRRPSVQAPIPSISVLKT